MEKISKAKFVSIATDNKLVYLDCKWGETLQIEDIKIAIDSYTKPMIENALSDPKNNRELRNKTLTSLEFFRCGGEQCSYLSIAGTENTCYKYKNFLITFAEYFSSNNKRNINSLVYQIGREIKL